LDSTSFADLIIYQCWLLLLLIVPLMPLLLPFPVLLLSFQCWLLLLLLVLLTPLLQLPLLLPFPVCLLSFLALLPPVPLH
jgi:hypothetical protein